MNKSLLLLLPLILVMSIYSNAQIAPISGGDAASKVGDATKKTTDKLIPVMGLSNDADAVLATGDGKYTPIAVSNKGHIKTDTAVTVTPSTTPLSGRSTESTYRRTYSGAGNINVGSWTQIISSILQTINEVEIFDSSGQTMELGLGAPSAESRTILIFPGGNGRTPLTIPVGSKISLRGVSGNASAGEVSINFYR